MRGQGGCWFSGRRGSGLLRAEKKVLWLLLWKVWSLEEKELHRRPSHQEGCWRRVPAPRLNLLEPAEFETSLPDVRVSLRQTSEERQIEQPRQRSLHPRHLRHRFHRPILLVFAWNVVGRCSVNVHKMSACRLVESSLRGSGLAWRRSMLLLF